MVFTTNGMVRTLTGYKEGGVTTSVRNASISGGGALVLTLASFTPTLSAALRQTMPLNWDDSCTGFKVTAQNPADVLTQWIAGLVSLSGGSSTLPGDYSILGFTGNATSAGGTWSESLTPGVSTGRFYDSKTAATTGVASLAGGDGSGGSPTFTAYFKDNNNATDAINWAKGVTPTWASANNGLSLSSFTGNFLQSTNALTAYPTVSGLTTTSLATHTLSGTGATFGNTNPTGNTSTTITLTSYLHKNNATSPTVSLATQATRPAAVTGTSYVATLPGRTASTTFYPTYPSFTLLSASSKSSLALSDVVSANDFISGSTLNDQQVSINYSPTTGAINTKLWFGYRKSAAGTKPARFLVGGNRFLNAYDIPASELTVGLRPGNYGNLTLTGWVDETYTTLPIQLPSSATTSVQSVTSWDTTSVTTYPSFYITLPQSGGTTASYLNAQCVSGTAFTANVNPLSGRTIPLTAFDNSANSSAVYVWFAVPNTVTQPTTYHYGNSGFQSNKLITEAAATVVVSLGNSSTSTNSPTYGLQDYTFYAFGVAAGAVAYIYT